MKKRMFWGVGILILLIGIVGVFLLMNRNTDTESEMVFNPPSEETSKNIRENRKNTHRLLS